VPLSPGSRHGVYQIGELLGKGGMGEVYRARDTKLDRDVAVKVLPESFARDPDLLARFEREAKTLASLNHPNIAHLYGLEESGGVLAIIMEFVPGPTLGERIRQGPVGMEEVIAIARQISDALEAAHDNGVIHRDLKPANVKITSEGVVKLLDFGLAKAIAEDRPRGDSDNTPTLTLRETQAGVILGTAGYMAPEQVRGTPVDKRADIWAFGVVLYELLTGKRAFTGATVADILATSLRAELDWTALPANTPREVRRLLERCLERDRKKRLRDIGDAWLLSHEVAAAPPAAPRRVWPPVWLWMALTGLLAAALVASLWTDPPPDPPLRRLNVSLGGEVNLPLGRGPAAILSPDGARLAYISTTKAGAPRLYSRRLDQAEARALAGAEDADAPFFSPDGLWIGFFAGRKLKKISVEGGSPVTLCSTVNDRPASGSWGEGDLIVATLGTGLVRVSASGGSPQPVTTPGPGEIQHRWPQLLPGGNAALFTSNTTAYADSGSIEAVTLATGARKVLHRNGSFGRYVPTGKKAGHLTWLNQGTLFAAPMDPHRLELTGPARPVVEDVTYSDPNGGAQLALADDGTLIYVPQRAPSLSTILWLDASGKTQPLLAKPGNYSYPVLSPDGRQLAFLQQAGNNRDIWVHELERDVPRRITFTPDNEYVLVWTPDRRWIIFSMGNQLRMVRADGGAEPVTIYESKSLVFLHAISADGRYLAFCQQGATTGNDLWTASLGGTPEQPKVVRPEPFQATAFYEIFAGFSPDGKWLAYASDESGATEVYARPFPTGSGKHLISIGGGKMPIWSPNGRELFYRNDDEQIAVVDYKSSGGSLVFSKPRVWSDRRIPSGANLRNFTLAPDGKRFAVMVSNEGPDLRRNNEVVFLENFAAELRRRGPR